VGTSVDGELMLLAVHARGASLGPRGQPPQLALELPALPPPSTGTLQGSTQVSPVPRAQIAPQPRQAPQPAVVPVPPSPANPDTDESESQPEPGNRPAYTPPAGAERPPTVQGRPPTVGGRPPT
jgi:general secretion pathway protein C